MGAGINSQLIQWILLYLCVYTVATVMLIFVSSGRCSRTLDCSAEAVSRAEVGFWVNQTIIIQPVITSLLHVITAKRTHYYLLLQ